MDAALQLTEVKETKAAKKSDGTKTKSVRGIPKLTDANWAGTEKSKDCMLILCEGDSAKAGILSGLSSEDRNIVGVYPLKGKLLNVRGEPVKKISENKEIAEIKQILGQNVAIYSPGIGAQGGAAETAVKSGANNLIVGREITNSGDPAKAARTLSDSIRGV